MKQVQLLGLTPEENNKPIFNYIDKKFDELKEFYEPKKPTTFSLGLFKALILPCTKPG